MALIVTDNSVRQINAALLSLEKKIGETNSEKAQDKQVVQMELKNAQYNFMAPLYQSGNSVSINTTGTWEGNARSATNAEHASTADNVEHANTATSANLSKTLDTVNGDKLQIGSGTAQNVTNAKHAVNADYAKNMYSQFLDLSSLDKTKFYPIFCISNDNFAEVAIHSPSFGSSEPYNQNRIHFDISTHGWTDTPYTLNIREYACFDNNEITIGCIGRGEKHGGWAIWLRGGFNYSCWTINCELSLKTSDYTYYDEKYTVGTNYYGGGNTSVSIVFTPQSTITNGAYSNRPISAPNITSLEQRTASLESDKVSISELDEKLNSPLPWRYNYLGTGYSSSLQYRKIGEGNFTYPTGNWSFYSEIDVLYHIPDGVVVRGTIFVSFRGRGSNIHVKTVKYNSENGVFNYLSKTKVNYKLDTTNKKIYLELLVYCNTNYTMLLFRNSLTRTGDMIFYADNFWTFAANGTYTQSATTMQAGATDGYTEIPLELINVDKYGRDIVTTYATKTELTNAVPTYSASDAGKVLAVNSDGTGTEWVKL